MRKSLKIRQNEGIIIDLKIKRFKTTILDKEHTPESEVVFSTQYAAF